MNIVLDTCPFCGIAAGHLSTTDHVGHENVVQVVCDSCGAMGPDARSPDHCGPGTPEYDEANHTAALLWNVRTAPAPRPDR